MDIYHYHPGNGGYLGQSVADESPLEPGVFLIPAHATDLEPPEIPEGMEAMFDGEAWQLVPIEIITPTPKTLAEIAAEKHAAVQLEKCRVRDAGVLVDGVLFDTDLAARIAYMELFTQFSADPAFQTDWKASDGVWVTMDATLFQTVMAAGKAHIQAAFAWQAGKDLAIAAALAAEDSEAMEAISTEYGN